MKHCNACNVNVDSPVSRCPLCYTTLSSIDNIPEPNAYPDLSLQVEAYNLLLRILIFASITLIVSSITINILTPWKFPWSLILTASIVYIWVAIGTTIRRRHKKGFNLMIQVINLSVLLLVLALIFDFKFLLFNIIYPALFISATISFNVIAIVRREEIKDFILYYLIVALFGFIPVILIPFKLVVIKWPAIVCAVYSVLSIISVFIFATRTTKNELKKRLKL